MPGVVISDFYCIYMSSTRTVCLVAWSLWLAVEQWQLSMRDKAAAGYVMPLPSNVSPGECSMQGDIKDVCYTL